MKKSNIQKQGTGEKGVAEHPGLRQTKDSASEIKKNKGLKATTGNLIPCQQKQCGYMVLGKGCRNCKTCSAEPYKVKESCTTCFSCEYEPGFVRWDNDPELKQQQEEFQKFKEDFQKVFGELMDKRRSEIVEVKNEI